MKNRVSSVLALLSILALGATAPAHAAGPIPPIIQTGPYKQLKAYVKDLRAKRNLPASPERRGAYKAKLKAKTGAAKTKVNNLFNQRSNRALVDERRQLKKQAARIKAAGRQRIADIKAIYVNRINQVKREENSALDRVGDRFAPKIDGLQRDINALRRQLLRTRNPVKKQKVQRKIDKKQAKLNTAVDAKNAATQAVQAKYQERINNLVASQNDRIEVARKQTQVDLAALAQKFKAIFNREIADIRSKKQSETGLVSDLSQQGFEYISMMPQPGS